MNDLRKLLEAIRAGEVEPDDELIDTLITVSVCAKRLAYRLRAIQAAHDFQNA